MDRLGRVSRGAVMIKEQRKMGEVFPALLCWVWSVTWCALSGEYLGVVVLCCCSAFFRMVPCAVSGALWFGLGGLWLGLQSVPDRAVLHFWGFFSGLSGLQLGAVVPTTIPNVGNSKSISNTLAGVVLIAPVIMTNVALCRRHISVPAEVTSLPQMLMLPLKSLHVYKARVILGVSTRVLLMNAQSDHKVYIPSRHRPVVAIPGKGVRCQWGQFGMRASPYTPPNMDQGRVGNIFLIFLCFFIITAPLDILPSLSIGLIQHR